MVKLHQLPSRTASSYRDYQKAKASICDHFNPPEGKKKSPQQIARRNLGWKKEVERREGGGRISHRQHRIHRSYRASLIIRPPIADLLELVRLHTDSSRRNLETTKRSLVFGNANLIWQNMVFKKGKLCLGPCILFGCKWTLVGSKTNRRTLLKKGAHFIWSKPTGSFKSESELVFIHGVRAINLGWVIGLIYSVR